VVHLLGYRRRLLEQLLTLSIPHSGGAPFEVYIWPATSSTSGVKGDITYIQSSNSGISSIDVSGLPELTYLNVGASLLETIDLKGLTKLVSVYLFNNKLTSVDVSDAPDLVTLQLNDNQLTSLDISNNLSLAGSLSIYSNNISGELDLTEHTGISSVYAYGNQLTSLKVSGTGVVGVFAQDNALQSVSLIGTSNINQLSLMENELTTIDLSDCTSLTDLYLNDNELESIVGLDVVRAEDRYSHHTALPLSNNNFSASVLNDIYTSIPDGSSYGSGYLKTIDVTGAPGAGAGSGSTPSIATSKGWTVVGDVV
jgi:hypothetical protein